MTTYAVQVKWQATHDDRHWFTDTTRREAESAEQARATVATEMGHAGMAFLIVSVFPLHASVE